LAEQQPLPVRHKALPLRHRPERPTSGDLNAVTVTVARATAPYEGLPEMSGAVHTAHAAPYGARDPGR